MYIGDWLTRRAMLTPDKVALIDASQGNRPITFSVWNRTANQTANFLSTRFNIQKGDRVAVLAMNCLAYLDIWFALGKLGGIMQNLNWRLSPRELSELVADATPKVLIYADDFIPLVNALRSQLPNITYLSLGNKAKPEDIAFRERENFGEDPPPEVELDWDDPWVICYTGGTTGTPKGALLTHRSITANAVNTIISWGLTMDDTTILNSPLFHTGGLNVFTAPLAYVGGTSIVCREFDLEQTFNLLAGGEVTIWFGVPTMFVMMQNHPLWPGADFSHLKLLISGGAPCPMPVFEKFWGKGVDFKSGYGLTEAGPNTFWLPPEDVHRKPGSVGFPLFHVDVKTVRADGSECGPDEVGELVVRGPHVCGGYWNNVAASADAIHPLPKEPEGTAWLHTGDLARRDAEGYYYIVGRSKDMFISGGENVYPAEIESVLHAHESVAETAVIAVPDETWGEVGRLIVVLKSCQDVNADDLLEFARLRLARYKVPKSVVFVDELPKTGANKVDKKFLVENYGN